MSSCVAFGCTNRCTKKTPGITFHRFPKDTGRRDAWVKAVCRKNWSPSSYSVLCSDHFEPDMFDRCSHYVTRLKENAVPSRFVAFPSYMQKTVKAKKAPKRKTEEPLQNEPEPPSSPSTSASTLPSSSAHSSPFTSASTLPSSSAASLPSSSVASQYNTDLKRKIANLEAKNNRLIKKVKILQQSKRRLEKKVVSLNDVIKSLKEKKLMEDDPLEILSCVADCSREFLLRQISKQSNTASPKVFFSRT